MVERCNRVLKETIALAKSSSLDWKKEVLNKVEEYRMTPHGSTGKPPFLLFRGRMPNTCLEPSWVNKYELSRGKTCSGCDVQQREELKAADRNFVFDNRNAVKKVEVKVGDWVMIKRPGLFGSSSSKFMEPILVVKVFHNAVKTQDHRIWNLNRVVILKGKFDGKSHGSLRNNTTACNHPKSNTTACDLPKSEIDKGPCSMENTRRSSRMVKRPDYLKDYA